MEQLTPDQAAAAHAKMCYPGMGAYYSANKDGFIAGTEWQKEQYKAILTQLLPILNEAFSICLNEGQDDVVERAEAVLQLLQD
jgi:hypothetical protein